MPTYDYECKKCQHQWEEFKPITSKPTEKCPSCGKKQAQRKIGPGAALLFKGTGFYITDYRSDNYKKGADADSKSASAASSESSKSSGGDSGSKSSGGDSGKSNAGNKS